MSAKLFFLTGLLGIGGYVGFKASNYDPAVVPYSKAEVQNLLDGTKTVVPEGVAFHGSIVRVVGRTSDGLNMSMQYSATGPIINCRAVITELGPKESRVVADCGPTYSNSAMAKTQNEMRTPMFDEHIQSVLQGRSFDTKRVESKKVGAAMRNMGGMQKEALKTADEMSKMSSQSGSSNSSSSSSSSSSGGWGNDTPKSSQ